MFAVFMLGKPLGRAQWFALLMLFIGVSLVQLQQNDAAAKSKGTREMKPLLGALSFLCVLLSLNLQAYLFAILCYEIMSLCDTVKLSSEQVVFSVVRFFQVVFCDIS